MQSVALAVLFIACVAAFEQALDTPIVVQPVIIKPPPSLRVRRATCSTPTTLTAAQQTETVNIHNTLRAAEGAANMIALTWDADLAANAQAWASNCVWEHGGLNGCGAQTGQTVGQNMYIMSGSSVNMTQVGLSWDGEKNNWSYSTSTCAAGAVCGHWSQLVWARTSAVGCGVAQCANMNVGGSVWPTAIFAVCDYNQGGNVAGLPVFATGAPCSNCDSDMTGQGYKCVGNLCQPCAGPSADPACTCGTQQKCLNGGTWNAGSCACICTKGWFGQTCQNSCTCADSDPVNCPSFAGMGYCAASSPYGSWMSQTCMTSCKLPCNNGGVATCSS